MKSFKVVLLDKLEKDLHELKELSGNTGGRK
jgi:hypothetical protein